MQFTRAGSVRKRLPSLIWPATWVVLAWTVALPYDAVHPDQGTTAGNAEPETTAAAAQSPAAPDPGGLKPDTPTTSRREQLNLLGVTDVASGESRRNENVQFNPVDNNALQELNIRLGTTATIVTEFQVERNYFGSEFGTRPTTPVHVGASRSSGLHGTLYATHTNSVFSARSFFQVGEVQPARENHYGFSVGTPLWRGGYFFVDGSQQKIRGSVNGNVLVPKADERTPLTTDPETREIVERFLSAYPNELPNRTDIDERALNTNSSQIVDTDDISARLDQSVGNDRITLRYALTTQNVTAFQLVAGQNPDTNTKAHAATITWNRTWSATTISDFSAGFNRVGSLLVPEKNNVGPNVMTAGTLEQLGPSSTIPLNRAQNLFRYAGRLRHLRGRHFWTAGFELARRQRNGSEVSSHRGFITFRSQFGRDAITNLRMGTPGRFSGAVGETHRGFRSSLMQFYVGDQWRPRPDLSLNFGLRYQPLPKPTEVNNLNRFPYGCDCNNVAGLFGFSYRMPGSWGVLRGAYGTHYADIIPSTYEQIRFNAPGTIKFSDDDPDLVELLKGLSAPPDPNARSTVFVFSPNTVSPYSQQYNLSWEPAPSTSWRLQLAYVGSRSHKLFMRLYTNRAARVPGIEHISSTVNERRPNADFFDIRNIFNNSRAYFDAGRVSLVIPRWKGFAVDGSYWFSKAIDLGADYTSTGTIGVSRSLRNQSESMIFEDLKGPSAFDQSHATLWRISYESPALASRTGILARVFRSWQLSTIALLKTGTPFTVITGSDAEGFGNVDGSRGDRPHLIDTSVLGTTLGHPDDAAKLPRSAFAFITPLEDRGNLGRNTFRRDGISNVNAAVSRTFRIQSEKMLIFRAESINFLNTPQFAEPTLELTAPSFGKITNTLNDGRTFRFLLRFAF